MIFYLALFLLMVQQGWPYREENDGLLANQHWRCTNCHDDYHAMDVFNQIHSAIRYGDRLSYLALDMNWIDRLDQIDAKVHVLVEDFLHINRLIPTERPVGNDHDVFNNDEEYQVIALHFHNYVGEVRGKPPLSGESSDGISRSSSSSSRSSNQRMTRFMRSSQQRQYHRAIDAFLAVHPCWIPLHEPLTPPTPTASADAHVRRQHPDPSNPPSTTRTSPTQHNQHHSSSTETTDTSSPVRSELLLFVRLPELSFHATCKLYTTIVKRQFPAKCTYTSDHMVGYPILIPYRCLLIYPITSRIHNPNTTHSLPYLLTRHLAAL